MANYKIEAPNGKTYYIEGPDGASNDVVAQAVIEQYPESAVPAPAPKPGVLNELKRGLARPLSSTGAGIESLGGQEDATAAGLKELAAQKEQAAKYGDDPLTKVKKTYEERGFFPAAGEFVRGMPEAVAQQLPQLAATAGTAFTGARIGAMTPIPGGALIGGVLGAGASLFPGFAGSNLATQAREAEEKGTPFKADRPAAYSAAAAQAALEGVGQVITLGTGVVSKILKIAPKDVATLGAAAQAKLVKEAQQSLLAATGKGAARAIGAEVPVEVAQQILERAQAGQSLTDEEALQSYGDAVLGTLQAAPAMGAAGNVVTRSAARGQVRAIEGLEKQKEALEQAQAEQKETAARNAQLQDPAYAKQVEAKYLAAEAQFKQLLGQKPAPDALPADKEAYKQAVQKAQQFRRDEITPLIEEYNLVKPVLENTRAEYARDTQAQDSGETYEAPLEQFQQDRDNLYAQRDTALAAVKQAKANGDFSAAQAAQDQLRALSSRIKILSDKITPRLPVVQPQATEQMLAKLNKQHDTAVASQKYDVADALMKEIARVSQQLEAQRKQAAAAQQSFPESQGMGPGMRMEAFQPPQAPQEQEAEAAPPLNTALRQMFGDKAQETPTPATTGPAQRVQTAAKDPVQTNMFPDMEPGGNAGTVVENLRAQIDKLRGRLNMSPQAQQQLENYAKAIEHPAMQDTNNAAAQNALELIKENLERMANQGAGQGAMRALSSNEVKTKIASIDARLKMLAGTTDAAGPGTGAGSIAQAQAALREAPFENQPARRRELKTLQNTYNQLLAERQRMATQARQTTDETYATPEKKWVTENGDATDKQVQNSQKWVDEKDPAAIRDARLTALAGTPQIVAPGKEGGDIAAARAALTAAPTAENQTQLAALLEKHQQLIAEKRAENSTFNGRFEESGTTKPGHPYGSGKEAFTVNADPQTMQEHVPSLGEEVETRTVPAAPGEVNAWGEAKINRGTEQTLGQTRAGPDDTALDQTLQQLSPADQRTIDMFDPVFGTGSKANQLVTESEEGLRKATDAVRAAESEFDAAKTMLQYHTQQLDAALRKDPASMQTKVLEGSVRDAERKIERADARVSTAEGVEKSATGAAAEAAAKMQQEVLAAKEAMKRARIRANEATHAFNQEVARLKASGELSEGLIEFVGNKNLPAELAEAQKAVSDVLARSKAGLKASTVKAMLLGVDAQASNVSSALQAQSLIQAVVPEVRKLMGPRVATLVDTMLRLRAAHNILHVGAELKEKSDALMAAHASAEKTFQQKAQAAQKALAAGNVRADSYSIKMEILRAEAQSARDELQALQDKIAVAQKDPGAPATQAARAQVEQSKARVEAMPGKISDLKKTAVERITAARTNVERAKETRAQVFANEAALRAGKEMPVVTQTKGVMEAIADLLNKREVALRGIWGDLANKRAEAQENVQDMENAVADLRKTEAALTALWMEHSSDMVDIDTQVATLVDSTSLIAPSDYDTQMTDAQRTVDRAVARGEANLRAKEEAALITEIDDALKPIRKLLEENAALLEKPQSPAHRDALTAHRKRLYKQMENTVASHADRLRALRAEKAGLEEAVDTAPEADAKAYAQEQIAKLRGEREILGAQLAEIAAGIKSVQAQREAALKDVSDRGDASLKKLRTLGLNDVDADYSAIRSQLAESLSQQREMEETMEREVAEALKLCEEEFREAGGVWDTDFRPSADYLAARKIYDEAVTRRARAYDAALQMMKDQLELVKQLPVQSAEAPATPTTAPRYTNLEGRTVDTTEKPVAATSINPKAIAATAAGLEKGELRPAAPKEVDAELEAFRARVAASDNPAGLRRELGSLQAQHEALLDKAAAPRGDTLTRINAAAMKEDSPWIVRATEHSRRKSAALAEQEALMERIVTIQNRLDTMGRPASLQSIATTQSAGRMQAVTKKERNAGDWHTGSPESRAGNLLQTGTRNRPTERKVAKTTTSHAAVTQANADTAEGTQLRADMTQGELERAADAAHAEYARLKERHDAVTRANVTQKTKDAVAAQMKLAEKADKAAQKALAEGTRTAATEETIAPRAKGTKVHAVIENMETDDDVGHLRATEDGVGTPLEDSVITALEQGKVQEALKRTISSTNNPVAKRVLSKIQSLMDNVRVKIVENMPGNNPDAPGGVNSDGTLVWLRRLNGLTEESLGHEVTHSVTLQQLQKPEHLLTVDQLQAKKELQKLFDAYKADAASSNTVAKESLVEFVAEAMGSRKLQQELAGRSWTGAAHGWAAFKRWALQLLGIKPPPGTMLDNVLNNAEKLFAAPEATASASQQAPAHLRSMVDTLSAQLYAPKTTALERLTKNFGLRFEQSLVDMRAPLDQALKTGKGEAAAQAMYFMRKADARMSHVYAVLSEGALKLVKGAKGHFIIEAGNSASAKDLFEKVGKLKGANTEQKMATADLYMKAIRAKRVGVAKMDLGKTTEAQLNALLKEVDSDPEQKAAMDEVRRVYNDYNRGMIEFLAESGAIPRSLAKELLKHGDYVPYYRVKGSIGEFMFDEEHPITIGDVRHQKYLQELKGDDDKFLPLNEAVMRNTLLLTDMAMRNIAAKSVAYALQDIGKGKGPVSTKTGKPTNLMSIQTGYGDDKHGTTVRFNQEPDPSDPSDDGKRHIKIQTEGTAAEFIPSGMLAQSIEGMSVTLPSFLKGAGWFSDVLRSGVTRNPMYVVRQLIRDPLSAAFTAGLDSKPLTAVAKSMAEFGRQMTGHSPTAAALIRKGVLHSQIFNGSPSDLAKMSLQIAGGNNEGVYKLFALADKAAMAADSATRAQVYESVIRRGGSEMEAEMAAIEMMNFHKRGGSPGALYASRMIPFFNAQIQGLNVLVKAASGNATMEDKLQIREKFINRALGLAAFTTLYAAAMSDDEEYKNARPRDRYGNFFIPLPNGTTIKAPIPFEVGLLLKALPEAFIDYMRGEFNEEEWKAVRHMLISSIPGASSWGMPQAVKPLVEVVANHDFYTGNPIESAGMEKLTPEMRFNANTTELAKQLSHGMYGVISPVDLEKIVTGYLGGLPVAIAALANEIFNTSGIARPERKLTEMPVFGSAFQDINGGGATDAMYAKIKALNEAKASAKKLEEMGDMKAVEALHTEVIDTLTGAVAGEAEKVLQELSKTEREIRLSDLTPERKREELDRVAADRTREMQRFLKITREATELA